MSDYIEREGAVKIIERLAKQLEPPINIRIADVRSGVLSAKWLVEDMQSTDVVEVVRCKDCKWHFEQCNFVGCNHDNMSEAIIGYPDDFCSYGERAEA